MIISGLLGGVTAACSVEEIAVLMKHFTERNGVMGCVEPTETLPTPKGSILRVRVDDIALARLRDLNMEMRIRTAGRVRFTEHKSKTGWKTWCHEFGGE